ncbi:hypothetical protein TraAM80_05929 [Trypanosoma rangeli]|uniref:Doublecortin domain-containing protein n=1 Tax=Trypanosoma rangeli TaxID=5698 RepID=A0A3R7KBS3_TRYRA|nr:uncharacterized protein TraAM80_05929 [Trypanosoma rangeli]RNF03350.1 hypothetical protein TraAM80_05929 [Trypanosoma rangeli]|eukprot:RNF03350.1 hypothetical protein TraAM80_05929 [Trypanosoma rangeli]
MRSAASRREEIQKKIGLLRQEREREQRAFEELASRNAEMTPAEIAEAARKKAKEEETTKLQVGQTIVSVGDYVQTIDDARALFTAESGIFILDPLKQVYLGEKGKVVCILPSFQGKSAVELVFADGATKVFLTECLALEQNSRSKKAFAPPLTHKETHTDPEDLHVPEFVPPPKPEPLPQPSWSTISMPPRKNNLRLSKSEPTTLVDSFSAVTGTTTTAAANKEGTTLLPPAVERDSRAQEDVSKEEPKENSPFLTDLGQPAHAPCQTGPENLKSGARMDLSIGLVKEVLSGRQRGEVSAREQLGSPIHFDAAASAPLMGRVEQDNLLKTPRVDFMTYKPEKRRESTLTSGTNDSAIPTHCPTVYKARFSLSDTTTRIPRFGSKCCRVAGALPHQIGLKFNSIVLQKEIDTLQAVLSRITRELKWNLVGHAAKRLFTTDGVEITRVDAIRNGMSYVVTPGYAYSPEPVVNNKLKSARPTISTTTLKTKRTLGMEKVIRPTAAPAMTGDVVVHTSKLELQQAPVAAATSSALIAQPSKSSPSLSGQPTRQRVLGKGIVKPISVRVFSNGEYGDSRCDPFPFRTVTLRPIHKTMRAIFNTIERDLEWHSMGKKVEKLYDATGCEITSIEELVDGQAIVVSTGDKFVVPHPTSVLHQDVGKLLANSNGKLPFTGACPRGA